MITIEKIIHKGENRIAVRFPKDMELIEKIKKVIGARWSQTKNSWHIPYTKDAYNQLLELFPEVKPVKNENLVTQTNSKENQEISFNGLYPKGDECNIYFYGGRILIFIRSNDNYVSFFKAVKGVFFDKERICWSMPYLASNLELLERYFGTKLVKKNKPSEKIIPEKVLKLLIKDDGVVKIIKTEDKNLKLYFKYNKEHIKFVKTLPYSKWNDELLCWNIPHTEVILKEIQQYFEPLKFRIEYSEEKRGKRENAKFIPKFRECPPEFHEKLILKRYSPLTVKTYKSLFKIFINYYAEKELKEITEAEIKSFLMYHVEELCVSESYQNQLINAIKFYYEQVLGGERKFYNIDRPFKPKTLPSVLSEEEVQKIIRSIENLKHKCIVLVIYSAGLRISELVNLKIKDIDSKRMVINICGAKGKKDRISILSGKVLVYLRKYFVEYRPKEYLFEGQFGGQYSVRSIQEFFRDACRKAKIIKKATVHTLRHCFGTHALEQGVDLRYIQALMGHESSKTTEIYTHITNKGMESIKSPLDNMEI